MDHSVSAGGHMPRGIRKDNKAVSEILKKAEKDLWSAWEAAKVFNHNVLRGTARENPLGQFLAARLPGSYGICSGEAIDCFDKHSTSLDLIVYDKMRNCPLAEEPFLMPAEALLAVVEVKSKLTRDELRVCFKAAKALRRLRPYKKGRFVPARQGGSPALDNEYRCLYTVFAYTSDVGPEEWLTKEWARIKEVADECRDDLNLIERVVVLDRGIIAPGEGSGKTTPEMGPGILHEWFLHLVNFLNRENNGRKSENKQGREAIDWQAYAARHS